MNPDQTSLFKLASARLQWLSDRQRVLSENIANADTAKYKARDVEGFQSYLDRSQNLTVKPTAEVDEVPTAWGEDVSGNSVILEEQLMLASSTAGQYRIAASLYRKAHEMLISVAGGR